jgi:hypothetical protein
MNGIKYKLIVPTTVRDLNHLLSNINSFFKFLPISKIIVIGNFKIQLILPTREDIVFLDEEKIVNFNNVENLIRKKTNFEISSKRTGWYVQQFIKIGYARICDDEYYLLWDSDTIPLKKITLFFNGKPVFNLKTEKHIPYFQTIKKLFPDLKKIIKKSFISEHMIIHTKTMLEMIDEIETNSEITGRDFIEKIIDSIDIKELPFSGFSEFETYGTFVSNKYSENYVFKNWKSLRYGNFFVKSDELDYDKIDWLGKYYNAVSFEKTHQNSLFGTRIMNCLIKNKCSAKNLLLISTIIRVKRKLYKSNKIKNGEKT